MKSWLPFRRRPRRAGRSASLNTRSVLKRRPLFETLELRRVLAVYTWDLAASALDIHLQKDESLVVTQVGSDFHFTSDSSLFFQAGGDTAIGTMTDTLVVSGHDLASRLRIDNTSFANMLMPADPNEAVATIGINNVTFQGQGNLLCDWIVVDLTYKEVRGRVTEGTIRLADGFSMTSTGDLGIQFSTLRNIVVEAGSTITTTSGDITMRANMDRLAQTQFDNIVDVDPNFIGIHIDGGTLVTHGRGNITLHGRGGRATHEIDENDNEIPRGNDNYGILLENGAKVQSTGLDSIGDGTVAGAITLNGRGGGDFARIPPAPSSPEQPADYFAFLTQRNHGVYITNADTLVTSVDGNIQIIGQGGIARSVLNIGVLIDAGATISSTGTTAEAATIEVTGTGGGRADKQNNSHLGTVINGGSLITSVVGDILVQGFGGASSNATPLLLLPPGGHIGVRISGGSQITSTGTGIATADIRVVGVGGTGGGGNIGVLITDVGSRVTSIDGDIDINGQGSGGEGVVIVGAAEVSSTGLTADAALITIGGTGSAGVVISDAGSLVTTIAGHMTIGGTGLVGVAVVSGGKISSTGTVDLTDDMFGDVGTISINGTGGGSVSGYGVLVRGFDSLDTSIKSSITSIDGTIQITGQGGGNGNGTQNVGVEIRDQGEITSTGLDANAATINIFGTGGSGVGDNHGVRVTTDGNIVSGYGDITINGGAGGTQSANIGVSITDGGQVISTGVGDHAASISIVGFGASTSENHSNHHGVRISDVNSDPNSTNQRAMVTTVDGDIHIRGTGGVQTGDPATQGSGNHGVVVDFGGQVISSGTGANAGKITIIGTGGGNSGNNAGVYIANADLMFNVEAMVTSIDGEIIVSGNGGTGSSTENIGIRVASGGLLNSTGSGALSLLGVGGTGTGHNYGVLVDGTTVSTTTGSLDLTGQGGDATAGFNMGVAIRNGGLVTVTGMGVVKPTLRITGLGGKGTQGGNYGVFVTDTGSEIRSGNTTNADIQVTGSGGEGGSNNHGVFVTAGGQIESAGTGTSAGKITISAVGGSGALMGVSNHRGVLLDGTSSSEALIKSVDGDIHIQSQGGDGDASSNVGVSIVNGGKIESAGNGANAASITVVGFGGTGVDDNYGVHVIGTGSGIAAFDGKIDIQGQGGVATGMRNSGVVLADGAKVESKGNNAVHTKGISITGKGGGGSSRAEGVTLTGTNGQVVVDSVFGNINITGTGGAASGGSNLGVAFNNNVRVGVTAGPSPVSITINGAGGSAGNTGNHGVFIGPANTIVQSFDGEIEIIGQGGMGESLAFGLLGTAAILAQSSGDITIVGDTMRIDNTSFISAPGDFVTLEPKTDGTPIILGGVDGGDGLALSDAELDRITAGTLIIGNATSGQLSIIEAITRAASTHVQLHTGGVILFDGGSLNTAGGNVLLAPGVGGIDPSTNGTEITAGTVSFQSGADLSIIINGGTVDTGYTQLNVNGIVDLTGVDLVLSGGFDPADLQVFTIVSAASVVGEFNGLPEGSITLFNGVRMIVNYTATTVTLTADRNTPPVANDQTVATRKGLAINGNLTGSDAENHTLTYQIVDGPAHGSIILDANTGAYTYTPDANYTGPDSFTFKVNDGRADSNIATVSITVSPYAPPTLSVQNSTGAPGALIPLNIQAAPGEVDDTFRVLINNVPNGSTFWRNGVQVGTDLGGGQWRFTQAQLNGLSIQLPANVAADVVLAVTARSVHVNGETTDVTKNLTVFVVLFDPPTLVVQDANGAPGVKIPLDIQASAAQAEDQFRVTISGVPAGATFWRGNTATGKDLGGGEWRFTKAWLDGLSIRLPNNHVGDVVLTVTAKATHIDGNSQEVSDTLTITVVPVDPTVTEGNMVVLGAEAGSQPWVQVINKATGNVISKFLAYSASFRGGVRVAVGDMTGDGVAEIITAQGAGDRNVIRVFTINGTELKAFRTVAYSGSGGVNVAVGDVDGDGRKDIVTAPSKGVTEIRVFRNVFKTGDDPLNPTVDPIGSPWRKFVAYPNNFTGGAVVAVADMGEFNGRNLVANVPDGKAEIIVGNGPGASSRVLVYNAQPKTPVIVKIINPFSSNFTGGISSIDVARVNGDAIPDIVVGAGQGFGSMVRVFDGRTGSLLTTIRAYEGASRHAAVHAAFVDTNNDGIADTIVTAQGIGGSTREIRSFNPLTGALVDKLFENDPDFDGEYLLATGV